MRWLALRAGDVLMRLRPWLWLVGILAAMGFLVAALAGVGCRPAPPAPTPPPP